MAHARCDKRVRVLNERARKPDDDARAARQCVHIRSMVSIAYDNGGRTECFELGPVPPGNTPAQARRRGAARG